MSVAVGCARRSRGRRGRAGGPVLPHVRVHPRRQLEVDRAEGVDLVIDRREGYYLYDMDGRRLINLHLDKELKSARVLRQLR